MAQDAISGSTIRRLTHRCITLCVRLTIAQGPCLQLGAHSLWSLAVLIRASNLHTTKIVDYCFTLREKGYRVYYQPESVIVHFEGASSGTDMKTGVKSYQAVNRTKFIEKWRQALKHHYSAPDQYDAATLNTLSRRNISENGHGN